MFAKAEVGENGRGSAVRGPPGESDADVKKKGHQTAGAERFPVAFVNRRTWWL